MRQILLTLHKTEERIMENRAQTKKNKGRKLSKEEFRSLLPEKINKLGQWVVDNRTAVDYGDGKIVLQ